MRSIKVHGHEQLQIVIGNHRENGKLHVRYCLEAME